MKLTLTELSARADALVLAIQSGTATKAEIQDFFSDVRALLKSSPALGKELGPLIPMINKSLKSQEAVPKFNWVRINEGYLAIGHKPGGKISFEGMKQAGVTVVLTLLQENEGARNIGNALERVQIEWLWFPFSAVDPQDRKTTQEIFQKMQRLLEKGGRIYVHCSAGIHRTGMVTYAFLRYLGQEPELALFNLGRLRTLTVEGATPQRLEWGDQFGS